MKDKKTGLLIVMCVVLTVLLIGMTVLSIIMWRGKAKAEEEAAEYKTSYENLVEETQKAEQAAKEEKEKNKQKADEYQASYNTLVSYMLNDAVLAEKVGNLIISVWHNAIWKTSDSTTDKFTKVNGMFVSDFNDALRNLFDDVEFSKNASKLSNNQQRIKDEMKSMLNPPEGYENAFKALESMYNSYISFTNIVIRCDGSLESFSNDFSEADEKLIELYHGAELYVK